MLEIGGRDVDARSWRRGVDVESCVDVGSWR
jgi:hypothetical protein